MPAAATEEIRSGLVIDVMIAAGPWSDCPDAEHALRKAIEAAAALDQRPGEVAVVLTDDPSIQTLNAQWRGIDTPTNVLSFPAGKKAPGCNRPHLGDIVIAYETVAREAAAENKAFLHHLAHLAIHGYLHLIGFDHETDSDACRMESLETRILSSLDIADPYADRTSAD